MNSPMKPRKIFTFPHVTPTQVKKIEDILITRNMTHEDLMQKEEWDTTMDNVRNWLESRNLTRPNYRKVMNWIDKNKKYLTPVIDTISNHNINEVERLVYELKKAIRAEILNDIRNIIE